MQPSEQPVNGIGIEWMAMEAISTQHPQVPGKEGMAALAHDARNMLAALDLYCDLLEEPGVLSPSCLHYSNELKMVAASSRRLVEKMGALGLTQLQDAASAGPSSSDLHTLAGADAALRFPLPIKRWKDLPALPIEDLASEVRGCQSLLAALAGSSISVSFDIRACELPVEMTGEDLTRVLVNLVKNASEAMTGSGILRISLREFPTESGTNRWVTLTVEDNGPGIPRTDLEAVFEPGYTTRGVGHEGTTSPWPVPHRGLGLAITRSIVETAGGRIHAALRDPSGVCFQIELPVRTSC